MKQAIFTVVNGAWVNELNIFVESWIRNKPADVDYILVHDGTLNTERLNHQPDILTTIPQEYIKRLKQGEGEVHKALKKGWEINSARIFIMDIYKDVYDKLIYFDADVLVVDLQAFLEYTPVKLIAAVEAEFTRESIEIVEKETNFRLANKIRILEQRRLNPLGYVNNGVMIINTVKLRSLPFNLSEMFVRTFGQLAFIDQDFINLVFSNDIEYLDRSFNYIPLPMLRDSKGTLVKYGKDAQKYYDKPVGNLKAIHYISGWRPWLISDTPKYEILNVKPVMDVYMQALERTPNVDKRFYRSAQENYGTYVKEL